MAQFLRAEPYYCVRNEQNKFNILLVLLNNIFEVSSGSVAMAYDHAKTDFRQASFGCKYCTVISWNNEFYTLEKDYYQLVDIIYIEGNVEICYTNLRPS